MRLLLFSIDLLQAFEAVGQHRFVRAGELLDQGPDFRRKARVFRREEFLDGVRIRIHGILQLRFVVLRACRPW